MTQIVVKKISERPKALQNTTIGNAFEDYLQYQKAENHLSDVSTYNLRTSTTEILNFCNPHDAVKNSQTTHLVVGYVQSGKTMSFTGVLALARDNGYRIAIVLTGVTNLLLGQTSSRLLEDLSSSEDIDNYKIIDNPTKNDADKITRYLRLSRKPLLIIPILKHAKHIAELTKLFNDIKLKSVLSSETAIIIDDEADQASLNNFGYRNSKEDNDEIDKQSAIYAAILKLRASLPGNSYIQYTATPQANLLITTMDLLSPRSHTLLTPGEGYIGGKKFFGMDKEGELFNGKMIITIPPKEVFHRKTNVLKYIPDSLCEAMMMHVWAVVLVIYWYKEKGIKQLSMMVHPTEIIDGNKLFEGWIRDKMKIWSDSLAKPDGHEDKIILMKEFEKYLPSALQFYPEEGRPTFDDVSEYIADVINDCEIYRVTGKAKGDEVVTDDNIEWDRHRMNILIGAQKLNRGFTVKNLATTYMPRHTTGVANADTIEQRCRFFGYKGKYIKSCRVYLPAESIDEYKIYVKHEEELRSLLAKCNTLKEYEHSVMLSPHLRPTRKNVLPKSVVSTKLSGWKTLDKMTGKQMLEENLKTIGAFVKEHLSSANDFSMGFYNSGDYEGYRRHSMIEIRIEEFIRLLDDIYTGNLKSSIAKSMMLRYFQNLTSNNDLKVKVIFMSCDKIREREAVDFKDNEFKVNELFQGRSNQREAKHYIGDRNLADSECITVQIHHLKLDGLPVDYAENKETYSLAINIPEKLSATYYTNSENF